MLSKHTIDIVESHDRQIKESYDELQRYKKLLTDISKTEDGDAADRALLIEQNIAECRIEIVELRHSKVKSCIRDVIYSLLSGNKLSIHISGIQDDRTVTTLEELIHILLLDTNDLTIFDIEIIKETDNSAYLQISFI